MIFKKFKNKLIQQLMHIKDTQKGNITDNVPFLIC